MDARDSVGLDFTVEKILIDDESKGASKNNKSKSKNGQDSGDDEPLDIDEMMAGLQEPIRMHDSNDQVMNESYFNLRMKDHYKIYTFKNKHV